MSLQEASPSDAVDAIDVGEDAIAEQHAAAEGVEASADVGSTSSLREMLMSTSPTESLDVVESPWDPERGGMTRVMRGFKKMTGVDGLPAIADVTIGLAEFILGSDLASSDDVDDVQEASSDDGGSDDPLADLDAHPAAGGGAA